MANSQGKTSWSYYKYAFLFNAFGLLAAAYVGYGATHSLFGAVSSFWSCFVLAAVEISLSFDNAVVNARILKYMSYKWRQRFLWWGIIIAVFGIRIFLPLAIVAILLHINPIAALHLAINEPNKYMIALERARIGLNALGGSFLTLVSLSFFIDRQKECHWINCVEKPLSALAAFRFAPLLLNLCLIAIITYFLVPAHRYEFLIAAGLGIVIFYLLALRGSASPQNLRHKSGFANFIYLEILDASFSFDGVIGAFALSSNFLIIALGLSIGAFYVRSMTIMLVEKESLGSYAYIEHGAFYAILSLAMIMYSSALIHIPDYIAGLLSISFIGVSTLYSYYENRLSA
ncbi:DUF475 domain-containing protein [Bartonella sp. TP]|uniref:DUF475 domain-containing protein n=1 Tax=Bartonella sp. TP TaxID=3057550 RepID=UPI0025B056D2|nr:DUF475 domain-containing protein [Bartonella sp. TP]MDN5249357.1 DUF475 domain-containing protein [Alphaproteobacteria bacterium]WJW79747.1 DUF475 domain-containing protein [Bartonella sp. TP]